MVPINTYKESEYYFLDWNQEIPSKPFTAVRLKRLMNIKTKKQNPDGIARLETSGEIKEIIFNEDFLKSKEESVAVCFRGKNSSGIVELSVKELENIYRDVIPRINLLGGVKVMKFKK